MEKKYSYKTNGVLKMAQLAAVLFILGFGSCQSTKPIVFVDEHTSQNSVNWGGVYTGIIPAINSPGIDVQINLYYDETFELWYYYIGEETDNIVNYKGKFNWDEAGIIITLDISGFPPHYWVGSNELTQLDMQRKRITGDLADKYELKKITIFDWPGSI